MRGFQRGFVGAGLMDLAFLLVLILVGWGLVSWFSTIVQGDFALAVSLTWLMAFAAAGWWTGAHTLVLRVPAGFLLFLGLTAVLGPLGWWSGSKLAVAATAVASVFAAKYLGELWSKRLAARLAQGAPGWLDPSINLLHDLGRWAGASVAAFFAVGVLPLLLVTAMNPEYVPWAALAWAFAATAFYIYKYRPARGRLFKLPLALYVFVIASVLLRLFRKEIVGPLEPGSFEEIAYVAYWPVVAALFTEFVLTGTRKARLTA